MRYAFMTFSTPALALPEVLALAARYGYDGVEPRLDAGHAHGVEVAATAAQRRELRRAVASSGLELVCLATSLTFADPARTAATAEQARARIELAADLGVRRLRVFGGKLPPGLTRAQATAQMAASLGQLAEYAAGHGVTLCVETHDDWCDPRDLAAVLRQVDHPAIGANWDIMHPVRAGKATMDEAFAALRPWIHHLHIHDGTSGTWRLAPIGTGAVDHRRALELLHTAGYAEYLSGEWIDWEPYAEHLPRELATMKRYERELGLS